MLAILPLMLPAGVLAQAESKPAAMGAMQHAEDCAAPVAPSGELSTWIAAKPFVASGDAAKLTPLAVGQAADVTLIQTARVKYALRPEKPGGSVSYGGMIAIDVAEAGTYRVALGSGAWIDLIKDGAAVASTAHGHGPACTGVRKAVDFPLTPGRYTLQIAANGDPQVRVLVARLP